MTNLVYITEGQVQFEPGFLLTPIIFGAVIPVIGFMLVVVLIWFVVRWMYRMVAGSAKPRGNAQGSDDCPF